MCRNEFQSEFEFILLKKCLICKEKNYRTKIDFSDDESTVEDNVSLSNEPDLENNEKIFHKQEDISVDDKFIETDNSSFLDIEKKEIPEGNDIPKINNEKTYPEQNVNSNTCNELRVNKESRNILNKVIKDFYKFHNKFLPERKNDIGNNFKNINVNLIKEHKLNVNNIIQYYEVFKKFKSSCKGITSKAFYMFIEYNNDEYCSKYYNIKQFYDKVKRCYDFITFFENQGIIHEQIVELIYKSNLSYTKLFKIRGTDYEDLKKFYIEKVSFINKTQKITCIKEYNLKHNNNKEVLLSYYGSKHNYKDIISKHIKLNDENKVFDLFSGSCAISYEINKIYPQNKIIINDSNKLLNNFYTVLKHNEIGLLSKIDELNTLENIKNYKTLNDNLNNGILSELEEAAVYYLLNKIAFNGNMYYDKKGKLYVGSKKEKSKLIIDINKFSNFSRFLNNIEINNLDLLSSSDYWLSKINKDDLVILDPPYDSLNSSYTNYGTIFDKKCHERLYVFIDKLIHKGAKVITFNGNTSFIKDLYKEFNIEIIKSYCQPSHNTKTELFIYN